MKEFIEKTLKELKEGRISVNEALSMLGDFPFYVVGEITLDTLRELGTSMCEVIWGEGKTFEQIAELLRKLSEYHKNILVTRVKPDLAERLKREFVDFQYSYGCFFRIGDRTEKGRRDVVIITAGTSDVPVAKESLITMNVMGVFRVREVYDIGVAGLHRLALAKEHIREAGVIVVVAGWDAALPSIIGGLTGKPIIAVPTSSGPFKGLSALLSSLSSCAPNVLAVGIDDGFGAGYSAALISRMP